MSDDLLSKTLPTIVGGAVLIGATKLLLDEKKGKKRKSMRLLDSVK